MDRVRAAVNTAAASGQMNPSKAQEFGLRLDNLSKRRTGEDGDTAKQVKDLSNYLTELVHTRQLTAAAFQQIQSALSQI